MYLRLVNFSNMNSSKIKQNVCTLEKYFVLLFTLMLKGDHMSIQYSHLF